MKVFFSLLLSLLCAGFLHGDSRISLDDELKIIDKLFAEGEALSKNFSEEIEHFANKIYESPGLYEIQYLLGAGVYFLSQNNFERGAELFIGTLLRGEIGRRITGEGIGAATLFGDCIEPIIEKFSWTSKERGAWNKAMNKAINNCEEWDRKTPHYDYYKNKQVEHSFTEDQKAKIIARVYREIKNMMVGDYITTEEDAFSATKGDEYFFDHKSRLFSVRSKSKIISFYVPKEFIADVEILGKYSGTLLMIGDNQGYMDSGYNREKEGPSCNAVEFEMGNGIKAYQEKDIWEDIWEESDGHICVSYRVFFFIEEKGVYDMYISFRKEREEKWLPLFKLMLNSLKIKDVQ